MKKAKRSGEFIFVSIVRVLLLRLGSLVSLKLKRPLETCKRFQHSSSEFDEEEDEVPLVLCKKVVTRQLVGTLLLRVVIKACLVKVKLDSVL